jgi:hypothetical protein
VFGGGGALGSRPPVGGDESPARRRGRMEEVYGGAEVISDGLRLGAADIGPPTVCYLRKWKETATVTFENGHNSFKSLSVISGFLN